MEKSESMIGTAKGWRSRLSLPGYVLVGGSGLVALAVWPWTCAMGGFHCFAGAAGHVMTAAQIGVLLGLVGTLFGQGYKRFLFATIALLELVFCYLQLLVH
jgi:hypothetical protein